MFRSFGFDSMTWLSRMGQVKVLSFLRPKGRTKAVQVKRGVHQPITEQSSRHVPDASEVRRIFIDYFVKNHDHTFVPSSSVLPSQDKSLLFVNAGMNQFKPILQGTVVKTSSMDSLRRVANSQKCIRAGGKHNDLEQVGHDIYHHTFFEMLGNWSFGDYFKEEACQMAWTLLTKVFKLDSSRLYVTYFGGHEGLKLDPDLECREIWLRLGVKEDHIFPFGIEDNFWEMGPVGPCGCSTEIHYDHLGSTHPGKERINTGRPDLVELWNLVFVQYERQQDGSLKKLPMHSVDTGMGLERLMAVLGGKLSNYDTGLFVPLFEAIYKIGNVCHYQGKTQENDIDLIDTSYRIVADHSRMFTVAISDGLLPDEFHSGNCLRKIIKRACWVARQHLGFPPGTLALLAHQVAATLGDFYSELQTNLPLVIETVNEEEQKFLAYLEKGLKAIQKAASQSSVLDGASAFQLYSSYGLSVEIIRSLAKDYGLNVDWTKFHELSEQDKEKTRYMASTPASCHNVPQHLAATFQAFGVPSTDDSHKYSYAHTQNQYKFEQLQGVVVGLVLNGQTVQEISAGNQCYVLTDKTCFYAEAGGQVSDRGFILGENMCCTVESAQLASHYVFHLCTIEKGTIKVGDAVHLVIDEESRFGCMRNHTAVHLLNAALHKVLPQAGQRSSYVSSEYLHFDCKTKASLTLEQVEYVEEFINQAIHSQLPVSRNEHPLATALQMEDLVTIPGEMYPDPITVITIEDASGCVVSREACCGTHLLNTEDVGSLVIVSQKPLGQTARRIHAVTGKQAEKVEETACSLLLCMENVKKQVVGSSDAGNVDFVKLQNLLAEVRRIRTVMKDSLLPLTTRTKLEDELETLEKRITTLQKAYKKNVLSNQVQHCVAAALEQCSGRFAVVELDMLGNDSQLLKMATKAFWEKPVMAFMVANNGTKLFGHCHVPLDCVTSEFSAQQWVAAIDDIIHSNSTSLGRDPKCFYFLQSSALDQWTLAIDAAKAFAKQHVT